jgi:hypothetical protein
VGARVHARLVTSFELAMADVILANGAGCYPLCPAAGILKCPLGKVKIEGPHFGQGFAKLIRGTEITVLSPVSAVTVFGLVSRHSRHPATTSAGRRKLLMPGW